jgi:endonuclease YncB( thermonuclease family)
VLQVRRSCAESSIDLQGDTLMVRQLTILIFLLILATTGNASPALVVDVVDGDTLKVVESDKFTTVRLYGIDCPEKKQQQGINAKLFIENMVEGKTVDINPINTDRYGRTVAIVMFGDQCLQEQLLVSGYAWVYPQYCKKKFCPAWQTLQKISADNKWGLWADPMPVQPWVWRKQQR